MVASHLVLEGSADSKISFNGDDSQSVGGHKYELPIDTLAVPCMTDNGVKRHVTCRKQIQKHPDHAMHDTRSTIVRKYIKQLPIDRLLKKQMQIWMLMAENGFTVFVALPRVNVGGNIMHNIPWCQTICQF